MSIHLVTSPRIPIDKGNSVETYHRDTRVETYYKDSTELEYIILLLLVQHGIAPVKGEDPKDGLERKFQRRCKPAPNSEKDHPTPKKGRDNTQLSSEKDSKHN